MVEQITEKFDIYNYKNKYSEHLIQKKKKKSKGTKTKTPELKVVHKQSDDLMAMLKASLENKKSS